MEERRIAATEDSEFLRGNRGVPRLSRLHVRAVRERMQGSTNRHIPLESEQWSGLLFARSKVFNVIMPRQRSKPLSRSL